MAVVETRISVWEALAGRAPGQPLGPADPGLWTAVAERLNPAKARPVLRTGIEEAHLTSARGVGYTMLRSPDGAKACYLRLTPEEVQLAHVMDGSHTLARLVAEFARISGRLAPDQVRRVVADLAGNRMLEELPVDAFAPLQLLRRRPWPLRVGAATLGFVQGRRVVLANIDTAVGWLYRGGGRLLFTRPVAALAFVVALLGGLAFTWQWWTGEQSVFLSHDSYVAGAAVLLGLNIVALACHELGHALATKHAGRRVPAAGFLVYFGIPSVFVDTTDVWMAGRRGRLLTTAAGPATGLVLAGASALVGFAVPEAAPWCFKLSFAWYINALFNLNPFLALDGYYLLMDWLEVPNLRARGLAWVVAQVRRRPPSWPALDREGRLVALYGMLAVGWLVIALNIGYRVYLDRVGGLVTGLWRSGWAARLLLVVVVAALMSPVVYLACGWVARRWRRLRDHMAQRHVEQDVPRRLDALRASSLRDLPSTSLAGLAAQSRWVYPRTGEQLVLAGAVQPQVYAVVEGALEARAPGDPAGTVRQRVGAGGVAGLGVAIAGTPSPLAWYAAGTKLLAVPAATLAAAVSGATNGATFGSAAEAQALFDTSPALAGLPYEDRLGLASVAVPVSVAPGASITLNGPDDAIVLASGVIETPDGTELGRGTLIGPAGEEHPAPVAVARTAVRLFSLPAVAGLPLLLGVPAGALVAESHGVASGRAPVFGVHPPAAYPPLAVPPGPPLPPYGGDGDDTDGLFERRLRWLLVLVVLVALLFTGANIALSPLAWAEMPSDKALLHVERGSTDAVVGGTAYRLAAGADIYVGESDDIVVAPRSRARLTFRGGASSVLCAGTHLVVGPLASGGHPVLPTAALDMRDGLALVDTASPSPVFEPLASSVQTAVGAVTNDGPAWFAVAPGGVVVADGTVDLAGVVVPPTVAELGCGGETVVRPSGTPSASPSPSESPSPTPSLTPSPTASASPTSIPTATTTTHTTTHTTTTTTTTTSPRPPPLKISWDYDPGAHNDVIDQQMPTGGGCGGGQRLYVYPRVKVDPTDANNIARMTVFWSGFATGSNPMNPDGLWFGIVGPVPFPGKIGEPNPGGSLSILVIAWDFKGLPTRLDGSPVQVLKCAGR